MEGPANKWTYETEYFRYDGCYPKAMHDCIAFCVFKEYYMDKFELYIVDMKYVRNLKNIEKQKTPSSFITESRWRLHYAFLNLFCNRFKCL